MSSRVSEEKADTNFHEFSHDEQRGPEDAERQRKEKALVRKLDCFIAPVMMLLMLISYLDRGNIGFAATQGMAVDINLKGSQLNTAISVFYIFYILAEFPTSILVKRLQFNRVIPAITFCWGVVCLFTGLVQSFGPLVVTRVLLGFFEGCLFPSMTLFLCNWYKREELAVRIAFLFIASALSGAFGGLLAWAMLSMDGVANMAGWRWLYIIEGLITVVFAACCIFLVPKNYETAYFLNAEDKAIMRRRAEEMEAYSGGSGHYGMKEIKEAAKDVKSWAHGVIQIAVVTILYGFGTFLPIIIKDGFHYSTVQAQYLVIPVNLWGALVYAVGAVLSDRYTSRFLPLIICAPFGVAGYAILLCDVSPGVRYFATYLIATACFLCTGGNIAWLSGNCAPDGKRAASLGILLTLTNIGGVVSGQIYQANAAPGFTLGHAWSLGCLAFAWFGWWIVRWIYKRRQAGKEQALAEGVVVPPDQYTDRAPDFKYQI
ncbi:major facilitator superfamily domain-containing protein [Phialemonium atrogriseum]|uniref:Major facilitator superfamily domain-containing protein n=1 Tax=Phialemonium atrogriseum TaxID=1093897 RepID=A0AAJ0FNW6_9PEZI|nr:major facilitator superfamily domain-containing protein [Phialemonium atrogriseum]KAK1767580.1 major facilitator superfamily domain-containing protein [Phialemonium atrogriseum]